MATRPVHTAPRHPYYQRIVEAMGRVRADFARRHRSPDRRSSPTQVEHAMGVERTWYSRLARREFELTPERLCNFLDAVEVEPSDFFGRAFPGAGSCLAQVESELAVIARGSGAYEARLPVSLRADVHRMPVGTDDDYVAARQRLAKLEPVRRDDPEVALRLFSSTAVELQSVDRYAYGHALALLATAYRALLRTRAAGDLLGRALSISHPVETDRQRRLGLDVVRRSCTLLCDRDLHRLAAAAALEGFEWAVLLGDEAELGAMANTRAIALLRAGDAARALPLYRRAIALLHDPLERYAASHGAAKALAQLGRPDEAAEVLNAASGIELPTTFAGHGAWVAGEIAESRGAHQDAAEAFGAARELLRSGEPADWALVGLQEARAYLLAGKSSAAVRVLRELQPAIETLSSRSVLDELPAFAEILGAAVAALTRQAGEQRFERTLGVAIAALRPLSRLAQSTMP